MNRQKLVEYLDHYLNIAQISDYGPQGLQVETANTEIQKVALSVDVASPILQEAAAWGADMLLAHHGIFWGGPEPLRGPLGQRVRLMMQHGLNLYAAHLPLDAHPEVGNNAVLGQLFGLQNISWWGEIKGTMLGVRGHIQTVSLSDFVAEVNRQLHTEAQVLTYGPQRITHVAILSGAGANHVAEVKQLGADCFLTGETSHSHYWQAADYGLNVIFAGHYATETVGVKALGQHLVDTFDLETRFFDFPTQM